MASFSVMVNLRGVPDVKTGVAADACWLDLMMFNETHDEVCSFALYLPGHGDAAATAARELATRLIAAAERIEKHTASVAAVAE